MPAAAAGLSASEWGRDDGALPAPTAAWSPHGRTGRSDARDDDDGAEEDGCNLRSTASFSLHLGHAALAIGVASVVLLMVFFKPGASFRTGMVVLGLIAALGAWRTARDFEWSPLARAVVAALAAVPLLGMAVCLGLLFKAVRERG